MYHIFTPIPLFRNNFEQMKVFPNNWKEFDLILIWQCSAISSRISFCPIWNIFKYLEYLKHCQIFQNLKYFKCLKGLIHQNVWRWEQDCHRRDYCEGGKDDEAKPESKKIFDQIGKKRKSYLRSPVDHHGGKFPVRFNLILLIHCFQTTSHKAELL